MLVRLKIPIRPAHASEIDAYDQEMKLIKYIRMGAEVKAISDE